MRMRFRKGNKVEVLGKKEVPSGSWYSAQIIHGNGHYYTVMYDDALGVELFDRVPRKAIRPSPPEMQVLEDWVSGDVVEVFHCFSWKMATVLRILPRDRLLVRLVGSSHEVEVRKGDIRPRLCWQDDQWKVIGRGSSNCEERQDVALKLRCNHKSQQMETTASTRIKNSNSPFSNISNIQEICTASQSLKRKLTNCHAQNIAAAPPRKKIRATQKDKRLNQFISLCQPPLPEKVDYVSSSRAMLAEKCTPPIHNRLTYCYKSILGRQKVDSAFGGPHVISIEASDAGSISSSVASCSMSMKNKCKIPENYGMGYSEDDSEYNSDAESCCQMGSEEQNSLLPADEKLPEEIHRIELQAYRSTIEALYASGPLSWEQETLLTNLRDSLHVTNDEHLMELRNLVSPSTCFPDS